MASALVGSACTSRLVTSTGSCSVHHFAPGLLLFGEVRVVIVIVTVGTVAFYWGWNNNSIGQISFWLESHGICPIFNNLDIPVGINVAVLPLHCTIHKPGLQFEGAISCLIPVGIGAILIILVDLFQNSNICCCLCSGCGWLAPGVRCLSSTR